MPALQVSARAHTVVSRFNNCVYNYAGMKAALQDGATLTGAKLKTTNHQRPDGPHWPADLASGFTWFSIGGRDRSHVVAMAARSARSYITDECLRSETLAPPSAFLSFLQS